MKILHVMPNLERSFGGPVESLIGYVNASKIYDVQTDVIAPSCGLNDMNWLREKLPGIKIYSFNFFGRHAWVASPGLWFWLWKNGKKYDLIHIHGLFNPVSSFSATVCRIKKSPYVIRPFGTLSNYTFSRTKWFKIPWHRFIDQSNLRAANSVHFTTEAEFEEANRLNIPFDKKKFVVPPPYNGEILNNESSYQKFPEPTCLYMSRLHPKKNIEGLLQAWLIVNKVYPSARLLIAGSGDDKYEDYLKDLVQVLNIKESVKFLGFVSGEEKKALLKKTWVFVLPSHQENFGVAVLEAIACGLPVVISEKVQLASYVKAEDLGKIVSIDPAEISESIIDLLKNKEYRKRCKVMGPRYVSSTFSYENIGQQLFNMYSNFGVKGA